mmetsp:Transcript_43727/g.100127  ORF Transcript_43727/g.100127 Transcript_43727/m.100127 type:complete len:85 (-) Transcript_43727:779-1033(-)
MPPLLANVANKSVCRKPMQQEKLIVARSQGMHAVLEYRRLGRPKAFNRLESREHMARERVRVFPSSTATKSVEWDPFKWIISAV